MQTPQEVQDYPGSPQVRAFSGTGRKGGHCEPHRAFGWSQGSHRSVGRGHIREIILLLGYAHGVGHLVHCRLEAQQTHSWLIGPLGMQNPAPPGPSHTCCTFPEETVLWESIQDIFHF